MYEGQVVLSESQNSEEKWKKTFSSFKDELEIYVRSRRPEKLEKKSELEIFGLSCSSSFIEVERALAFLAEYEPFSDQNEKPLFASVLSLKIYSLTFHMAKLSLDDEIITLFKVFLKRIRSEFPPPIEDKALDAINLGTIHTDYLYSNYVYEKRKKIIQEQLTPVTSQLTTENYAKEIECLLLATADPITQFIIIDAFSNCEKLNSNLDDFIILIGKHAKAGVDGAAKWLVQCYQRNEKSFEEYYAKFSVEDRILFLRRAIFLSLYVGDLSRYFAHLLDGMFAKLNEDQMISTLQFLLESKEINFQLVRLNFTLISALKTRLEYSDYDHAVVIYEENNNVLDNSSQLKECHTRLVRLVRLAVTRSWENIIRDENCHPKVKNSNLIYSWDPTLEADHEISKNVETLHLFKKLRSPNFFSLPTDVLAKIVGFTQKENSEAELAASLEFKRLSS